MNSHEFAHKLHQLADYLLSKPEFKTDGEPRLWMWYWGDKEGFLSAVRACGSGKKEYSGSGEIKFIPSGLPEGVHLSISAARSTVCRKVQEEKWECEPLLSQAEEAEISA